MLNDTHWNVMLSEQLHREKS